MKIFIDSADLDEISQVYKWGVANGVTTNPSLLKKAVDKRVAAGEKLDIKKYIKDILSTAKGTPVSLEVTELKADKMIEQGKRLFDMFNPVAGNVNIKIPVNPAFKNEDTTHFDGLEAVRKLSDEGIPVNCTLVFTPEQALLAAKAGAKFISPFAGRIDDYIRKMLGMKFDKTDYFPAFGFERDGVIFDDNGIVSGVDLVGQCVEVIEHFEFESEIIAASLRNTRQARESALAGAHIATLPLQVILDMLKHYKTFEGMETFTADIVKEYAEMK